jgi:hypothetical protein
MVRLLTRVTHLCLRYGDSFLDSALGHGCWIVNLIGAS